MPEIIETTVYQLHELSDAAKEKARAWFREGGFDHDWYDAVYADFEADLRDPRRRPEDQYRPPHGWQIASGSMHLFPRLLEPGRRRVFRGRYTHAPQAPAKIRQHAPQDASFTRSRTPCRPFNAATSTSFAPMSSHRGRYYHEYCMAIVGRARQPDRSGHDR